MWEVYRRRGGSLREKIETKKREEIDSVYIMAPAGSKTNGLVRSNLRAMGFGANSTLS